MPSFRFGKHPPKVDYRTLRLKDYLQSTLKPPPTAYDNLETVYKNLKVSDPAELFPMDANDSLGDCTIAALAHADTVFNGLVGKTKTLPKQAVYALDERSRFRTERTGCLELLAIQSRRGR
jgi:hypothetical protein